MEAYRSGCSEFVLITNGLFGNSLPKTLILQSLSAIIEK